jgi:hypothetical protein
MHQVIAVVLVLLQFIQPFEDRGVVVGETDLFNYLLVEDQKCHLSPSLGQVCDHLSGANRLSPRTFGAEPSHAATGIEKNDNASRAIVAADALRLLNISAYLDLEIGGSKIVNHFAASVADG